MNEVIETEVNIEDLIYEIRGKQVMLDSDLARLYKCKNGTKEINQAVKNNIEKFPERFSWIIDDIELEELRSKFLTTNYNKMSRTNPRVFTEQGVMMLATIIKSKVATATTIRIMDAFVEMKKFFSNDILRISNIEKNLININNKIDNHDKNIKLLQESFDKLSEKRKSSEIYYKGQIYDAYSKIIDIFNESKEQLIIIDAYADKTLLDIIKRLNVKVSIITKPNNLLTKQDIEKYYKQYNNLKVIYDNTFHDRYFIIDDKEVYHCGTSINRIGYKTFSITLMNDKEITCTLINKIKMLTHNKKSNKINM